MVTVDHEVRLPELDRHDRREAAVRERGLQRAQSVAAEGVQRAEVAGERAGAAVCADERVDRDRADPQVPAPERLQPPLDLVELQQGVAGAGPQSLHFRSSVQPGAVGIHDAARIKYGRDQAAHLPRLVGKAGEAAAGADTRPRRRRARGALDDVLQSRDHDAGTAARARARSRLRRVRVRTGRLDDRRLARSRGSAGIRSGVSAGQRRLRSRPVRRRRSACAEPSSSTPAARSFRPICSASRPCATTTTTAAAEMRVVMPEAAQGDRERGARRPHRGPVVAVLPDRAQPRGSPPPSACCEISRDRDGALELAGRSWQEDGSLSARYWSEAVKEKKEPPGVFYYWKGERPLDPNAPAAGRDGRDPDGVRRSRGRVLDYSRRDAPRK